MYRNLCRNAVDCRHCTVPKTFTRGYVAFVLFQSDNVHCQINVNFHSQPIICWHFYVTMVVENFLILKKILMFYGARARF